MQEPSTPKILVYYINKISVVLMFIGVAGMVIGAVTRDNAPIALIGTMIIIGIIGLLIYFVTKAVWNGMEIASKLRKK